MRAVQINAYGGAEVLSVAEVPEPHAGPGEVRIQVRGASVNPIDWKIRRGYLAGGQALASPQGVGNDAAGVVDEVGDSVAGVGVGDEVFGLGARTQAELAVLRTWAVKAPEVSWEEAAGAGVAAETTARAFGLVGVSSGSTVLIDGGSGGVGSVAVQIAVARGMTVIATASEPNQEFLAGLGATPVVYGPGLADRVRAAAPGGVNAVFDVAGKTPAEDLIALVERPDQVVTIANFGAGDTGIQVTSGGAGDPQAALEEAAGLLADGRLSLVVRSYPLDEVAAAQQESEGGHVRGKLVLVP